MEAKLQGLRPGLLLVPPFPPETRPPLPTPAPHPAPGTVSSLQASFRMTACLCGCEVTPLNPVPTSQPPELPEKPAPVPSDETADPAERRLAPRVAAGDRQGEPRAPAGETQHQARDALAFYVINLNVQIDVPRHSGPSSLSCHCATAGDPNQPGGFHSNAKRTQSGGSAWRRGAGRWRDSRRHKQRQSHEIHPGHATGERGHREGEDIIHSVNSTFDTFFFPVLLS